MPTGLPQDPGRSPWAHPPEATLAEPPASPQAPASSSLGPPPLAPTLTRLPWLLCRDSWRWLACGSARDEPCPSWSPRLQAHVSSQGSGPSQPLPAVPRRWVLDEGLPRPGSHSMATDSHSPPACPAPAGHSELQPAGTPATPWPPGRWRTPPPRGHRSPCADPQPASGLRRARPDPGGTGWAGGLGLPGPGEVAGSPRGCSSRPAEERRGGRDHAEGGAAAVVPGVRAP